MSDPIIRDSTPKGSPILAYGEISKTANFRLMLAVFTALTAILIIVFFVVTLVTKTLPVPRDVSLIAFVPASATLPDTTPDLWRNAQKRARPFPIFVGFALGDDDAPSAFAIAPRTFSSEHMKTSWVWQLIRASDRDEAEVRSPLSLASVGEVARGAWLRVWPARLFATTARTDAFNADRSIGGSIRERAWRTDLPAPSIAETRDRIMGQNMLMVAAVPNAWPLVEAILRERGFDMRLHTAPAVVRWSAGTDNALSVSLEFSEPLQTSTRMEIAGSVGLADRGTFTLPDGTVIAEFRLPEQTLTSTTGSTWVLEDGRIIVFKEKDVFVGDSALLEQKTELPKTCQGHVLAVFDGLSTQNFYAKIGIPNLLEPMRVIWLETNGKLTMCWE